MTGYSKTTEIATALTPSQMAAAVERAASFLAAGELVALPTETVYGLAANALDSGAVAKIFRVKRRPHDNPIIVHVSSLEMAHQCVAHWPALADELAQAFWPGPLTLVLPRSQMIPESVTAGGNTVGVRWPAHPMIQAVIRRCGFPLAAPSANLSTELSPTTAEHVYQSLAGRIPLILDGGSCQVGIESTVLTIEENRVRILRPGMIHEESIRGAVGRRIEVASPVDSGGVAASPGLMPKHYAPRARLIVRSWDSDAHLGRQLSDLGASLSSTWVLAYHRIPSAEDYGQVCVIPHDAVAFGRAIYAELHRCDEQGAQWIVVEALPESTEWRALRDRLERASATER